MHIYKSYVSYVRNCNGRYFEITLHSLEVGIFGKMSVKLTILYAVFHVIKQTLTNILGYCKASSFNALFQVNKASSREKAECRLTSVHIAQSYFYNIRFNIIPISLLYVQVSLGFPLSLYIHFFSELGWHRI